MNGNDYAAVSFGISFPNDEWRLEFGLDAKTAHPASELRKLIDSGRATWARRSSRRSTMTSPISWPAFCPAFERL
jgi:hypothetical protein